MTEEGTEATEPKRPLLDRARPLRMPGESLRSVQPAPFASVQKFVRSLIDRRRAADVPRPVATSASASSSAPAQPGMSTGMKVALAGLTLFAVLMIAVVPFQYDPGPDEPVATETTQANAPASSVAAPVDTAALDAGVQPAVDAAPPPPKVFRVGSLKEDPSLEIVEGTVGKRTLVAALAGAGMKMHDAYRVLRSFKGKTFDRPGANDAFVFAKERSGGRVTAFEYIVPPFDVWQARDEGGKLEGKKVVFTPEPRRVVRALSVGEDLRKSLEQAELDDDLLAMLDDALDGHAELVDVRAGARLRIVAEEERIEGAFARYSHVDAVEYFPANPKAKHVRVYRFDPDNSGKKRSHAFWDAEGRQPFKGGFRTPVPLARLTSRFNPRRMHPVLKVVMPHNGVDFAAPPGTPVYATAGGVVKAAGMAGPNGNMVQVLHANGLTSAYCHLSRFAAGLKVGQHVESRQLVGYVGTTGRSTGPHLHFAIKRGEVFLDPLSLRLDGWRTLPPLHREAFDKARAELDAALETVPMPAPPDGAAAANAAAEVEDVIYDDVAADAGATP